MKQHGVWFLGGVAFWLAAAGAALFFADVASGDLFNFKYAAGTPSATLNSPAWSFVEISDLHAGSVLNSTSFTNTINTILAHQLDWNIKLFISAGDLYEQTTNLNPWTDSNGVLGGQSMTNQLWRLKNAGISVMAVPGNHDSDVPNFSNSIVYWNDVFGTNFYAKDPYWFSNMIPGSTRDMAFKVVVGSSKFMFVGLRWIDNADMSYGGFPSFQTTNQVYAAYATNTAWCSNLARQFPDYEIVPVTHYFIGIDGLPGTKDNPASPDDPTQSNGQYVNEGPGIVLWNAMKSMPNYLMTLCGHVRNQNMKIGLLYCDDGHMTPAVKFNTQSGNNSSGTLSIYNGGTFTVYTVYPSLHLIHAKNYSSIYQSDSNTYTNRFLSNGEFYTSGNLSNDWSFSYR